MACSHSNFRPARRVRDCEGIAAANAISSSTGLMWLAGAGAGALLIAGVATRMLIRRRRSTADRAARFD
jgi:hypothetical protein